VYANLVRLQKQNDSFGLNSFGLQPLL